MLMNSIMDTGSQFQEQIEDDEEFNLANLGAVGGARPKRRTEKGKAYIAHIRWMDCYSIQEIVSREIERTASSTESADNVDIVERDLAAFRVTDEEMKKAVAALLHDLETDEELNVANDWYAEQYNRMNNFIETTERWISSAKKKIEENLDSSSTCTK